MGADDDVTAVLAACCAAPGWVARVRAGWPYPDLLSLLTASDAAFAHLGPDDVAAALAAHPRIGQPPAGPGVEAAWSRREQAGAAGADPEVRRALAAGNAAYERRFGHVFLICATGLTAERMLSVLTARLTHDRATENRVIREELRKITAIRLERRFAS